MSTNFEHQLAQMLPLMREKTPQPETKRWHSLATTLLGFALGMFVMYCVMQPNDTERRAEPQATFKLVFDESNLHHVRTSADVVRCIVRVPIPKPETGPTLRQYGALRESLRQF
jgi:hypothetical protein